MYVCNELQLAVVIDESIYFYDVAYLWCCVHSISLSLHLNSSGQKEDLITGREMVSNYNKLLILYHDWYFKAQSIC